MTKALGLALLVGGIFAATGVGVLLTLIGKKPSDIPNAYEEVQWDPYPYSYAFGG